MKGYNVFLYYLQIKYYHPILPLPSPPSHNLGVKADKQPYSINTNLRCQAGFANVLHNIRKRFAWLRIRTEVLMCVTCDIKLLTGIMVLQELALN